MLSCLWNPYSWFSIVEPTWYFLCELWTLLKMKPFLRAKVTSLKLLLGSMKEWHMSSDEKTLLDSSLANWKKSIKELAQHFAALCGSRSGNGLPFVQFSIYIWPWREMNLGKKVFSNLPSQLQKPDFSFRSRYTTSLRLKEDLIQ